MTNNEDDYIIANGRTAIGNIPLDEPMGTGTFYDVVSGRNKARKKQLEQEEEQKRQREQIDNSPFQIKSLQEYIDSRLREIRPMLTKLDNHNRLQTMMNKPQVTDIGEPVACPLCEGQRFKSQDYDELKGHIGAHREVVELKARLKKSQEIVTKLKSDRQTLESNLAQMKEQLKNVESQIWHFQMAGIYGSDNNNNNIEQPRVYTI